jgi:excisionase family DNA binding protein
MTSIKERQVAAPRYDPEAAGLLTPGQARAMLGVDEKTVHRWAETGRLGPVRRTIGGHRRYEREAVAALAQARQAGEGAA